MKMKKQPERLKPTDSGDPTPITEEVAEFVSGNITCSYGIHRGKFPVGGMKVKAARTVLKKLMKVDDQAIAVINGQEVGEDETISAETTMLSFVKPSAKKGVATAETITIDRNTVKMESKKLGVDQFCGLVAQHTVSGLDQEPIPDNVKWLVRAGKLTMFIVELKPELRSIKWLADDSPAKYGEGAKYTKRRLATPYVVMKAGFMNGKLGTQVELFYRNLPLASLDDQLYHTNLYNVSPGAYGCVAWFCTQYLNVSGCVGHADILSEIMSHVWGGGFNASSEAHEGRSGFSLTGQKVSDERVTNVKKWEQASEENPRFVLDVEWHSASVTPRQLIEKELKKLNIPTAPATSAALGNILLASKMLA